LRFDPVLARRNSFAYRAGKFVRRYKAPVAVASAALAALIMATLFSIAQMREAQRQRDAAVVAEKRADAQAEFSSLLMSQVGERPMTVREILDQTRTGIEHQYTGDPGFISSALLQLSAHYAELGDSRVRGTLIAR